MKSTNTTECKSRQSIRETSQALRSAAPTQTLLVDTTTNPIDLAATTEWDRVSRLRSLFFLHRRTGKRKCGQASNMAFRTNHALATYSKAKLRCNGLLHVHLGHSRGGNGPANRADNSYPYTIQPVLTSIQLLFLRTGP